MLRGPDASPTSVTDTPMCAAWAASSSVLPRTPRSTFAGSWTTRSSIRAPECLAFVFLSRTSPWVRPATLASRVDQIALQELKEPIARPLLRPHREGVRGSHLGVDDLEAPGGDLVRKTDERHFRRVRPP